MATPSARNLARTKIAVVNGKHAKVANPGRPFGIGAQQYRLGNSCGVRIDHLAAAFVVLVEPVKAGEQHRCLQFVESAVSAPGYLDDVLSGPSVLPQRAHTRSALGIAGEHSAPVAERAEVS